MCIPGFKLVLQKNMNRRHARGRFPAGEAVFVSEKICHLVRKPKTLDLQKNWVEVNLGNVTLYLCLVYRPPVESPFAEEQFWNIVSEDISLIFEEKGPVPIAVAGDMNSRTANFTCFDFIPGKESEFSIDDMSFDRTSQDMTCLLYTSPSPRDKRQSRMPSSA